MRYVRSNTATRLTVGPFYDKTDGVTPETALTVTSCKLTLMVDDGGVPTLVLDTNPTASGGNNDMVHVTGDDAGFYDLELTASNLNYLGRAMLAITDAATHCPVFHELMILPAVVYDALVLGTDNLDVNVAQWLGTAAATPTVAGVPEVDITHIAGAAVSTSSAQLGVNVVQIEGSDATNQIRDSVVDDATRIDASALNTLSGHDPGETIMGATDLGTGAGLTSLASQASVNTIDDFLDTEIATLIGYGAPPSAAAIADQVWEEALSDHSGTAGSTAEQLAAAGAAGDPWATALPGAYGAGTAGKIVGDNLNATVSSRATQASVDTIDNLVDDLETRIGTPSDLGGGATVAANLADIEAQTDDIPAVSGQIDAATTLITSVWEAVVLTDFGNDPIGAVGNDTTHVHLVGLGAEWANDTINGYMLLLVDDSSGWTYATWVTDWDASSELATVSPALPVTPEGGVDLWRLLTRRRDSGLTSAEAQSAAAAAIVAYDPPTKAELDAAVAPLALEATAQSILTDTGTDIPATLATIAGYLDTEIAAILAAVDTEVAAILADTNELQTDWANGGRLDLLLDAIKAKTDSLTFSTAGQVDAQVISAAANSLTAAAAAADLGTELATAVWASATRTLSSLGFTLGAADLAADTITAAKVAADVGAEIAAAVLTTAMTESYNADGSPPTLAQALFVTMQRLTEFAIAGTTITVKKLDGTTTAYTLTLDDDTSPTSSTRAT